MWRLLNGRTIKNPQGVTIDDVQHPQEIFRRWSKAELAAIGIKPYREIQVDTEFYTTTGHDEAEVDGEIVRTPRSKNRYTKATLKERFGRKIKRILRTQWLAARVKVEFFDEFDPTDPEREGLVLYMDQLKLSWLAIKAEASALDTYEAIVGYVRSGWQHHLPALSEEDTD